MNYELWTLPSGTHDNSRRTWTSTSTPGLGTRQDAGHRSQLTLAAAGRGEKKGRYSRRDRSKGEKIWNPVEILFQTLHFVDYSLTRSEQHYSSCCHQQLVHVHVPGFQASEYSATLLVSWEGGTQPDKKTAVCSCSQACTNNCVCYIQIHLHICTCNQMIKNWMHRNKPLPFPDPSWKLFRPSAPFLHTVCKLSKLDGREGLQLDFMNIVHVLRM